MKIIDIIIDTTGIVSIEAVGFKGKACEKATEAFEKALGKVSNKKLKPEYHQTVTQQQKVGS